MRIFDGDPGRVVLNNAIDFSIATAPNSQSVTQGGATGFTSTIAGFGGFSGTANFSVSGLPAGVTGMFSPTTVTGAGIDEPDRDRLGHGHHRRVSPSRSLPSAETCRTAYHQSVGAEFHPDAYSDRGDFGKPSVFVGGTQQFIATGTYSDSSAQDLTGSVTWTSSTPTAATINSAGLPRPWPREVPRLRPPTDRSAGR